MAITDDNDHIRVILELAQQKQRNSRKNRTNYSLKRTSKSTVKRTTTVQYGRNMSTLVD